MTSVIAHRGASRTHVPNSLAAIRAAREQGADAVALDVRRTADGVIVVHDDAQLADGRVLAEVDAGDLPASVPLLIDALEAAGDLVVAVELRNTRDDPGYDPEHRVSEGVAALMLSCAPEQVLVTSLNLDALARIRTIAPELATAWRCFDLLDANAAIERCVAAGHRGLHPHVSYVDRRLVERAHAAGLAVRPWLVDDPARMAELVALGVDGLVTDVPEVARRVVDAAPA